jgi:hypothetical protein
MSEGTAKIAAALAGFQAEMPTVTKGKTAKVPTKDGGSYSYTYADLADVTAAAMPILTRHGLAFTACPRHTEHGYELVGRLLHDSGEALDGSLPLHGSTAQQIGSSLTYNRRYLFGCMTGLITDDDNDGAHAGSTRAGDRRPEQAADVWARARRARDLDAIRVLWNDADQRGLLGVDVTYEDSTAPLGERLRKLGDSLAAFEQPAPPAEQPTPNVETDADRPQQPRTASQAQHRMLNAVLTKLGVDRDDRPRRLDVLSTLIGRRIDTSKAITAHEMKALLDGLQTINTPDQLDGLIAEAKGGQS